MASRWAALVCAAAAVSAAAAVPDSWLNKFGTDLREKLGSVLDEQEIHYYEPVINVTYVSTSEFDMRAMGMLYNSTGTIIDFIVKKQAIPEDMLSIKDGNVELNDHPEYWREVLKYYAGPLAFLVVALLLVAALPLAGLFWCCCYWCKSGRRRRPYDRKHDACIKGLLAILLIGLLTAFLFGVVCVFATEEQLEVGIGGGAGGMGGAGAEARGVAGAVRRGVRDVQEYLNATSAHAHWLLVVNYKQLERHLLELVNNSGARVSAQLGEFSQAVSVTQLNRMVLQLGAVQSGLRDVQRLTNELRYNAERLNAGLRKVRADLITTLRDCNQPECLPLQEKYNINQLSTQIHYSQIPDVSELLENVSAVVRSDIAAEVGRGHQVFLDIQRDIQRELDQHVPETTRAITQLGEQLEAIANNISRSAAEASRLVGSYGASSESALGVGLQYAQYRRMEGLAVASALLLITCLLTCGLVCGVCGKRPDAYSASDCCNKAHGARSLLCGMVGMFTLGGVAALLVSQYFALGVLSQRLICDPLTETTEDNRIVQLTKQFVSVSHPELNRHNITEVMQGCHRNQTLYVILNLKDKYELESLQLNLTRNIENKVNSLVKPGFRPRHVVILQPGAKQKLADLTDSGLSDFNFDRILDALETNITSLSLDGLARQLEDTVRQLRPRAAFNTVTASLQNCAATLRTYHTDLVLSMTEQTRTLNLTATKLRDGLRLNYSSMREAVEQLMLETDQAEEFLNTKGPQLISNLTRSLGSSVSRPLEQYLRLVSSAARSQVGRCGPLSRAYNSTRDALCRNVLMPLNGNWISVSWCILIFVPLMVVAQRLSRLYRHLDPYPGPLVEAEYLYDAYADRDNVPLANAYKAEKRSRRGGGGGGGGTVEAPVVRGGAGGGEVAVGRGGGGGGGGGGEARAAPHVDAHHARRYNDMAPKHWEEGPPRYHGPTEYERPPPYYYPGPADRQ